MTNFDPWWTSSAELARRRGRWFRVTLTDTNGENLLGHPTSSDPLAGCWERRPNFPPALSKRRWLSPRKARSCISNSLRNLLWMLVRSFVPLLGPRWGSHRSNLIATATTHALWVLLFWRPVNWLLGMLRRRLKLRNSSSRSDLVVQLCKLFLSLLILQCPREFEQGCSF